MDMTIDDKLNAALNDLLFGETDHTHPPTPDRPKAVGPDPAAIQRLKSMVNGRRPVEAHPKDKGKDPAWVAEVVALYGDIAAHSRMFRLDPRDGHERIPDEVRTLVSHLCRQRGLDAIFDMLMGWRGFDPANLPKEVLVTWTRLFQLPDGFFEPKKEDEATCIKA